MHIAGWFDRPRAPDAVRAAGLVLIAAAALSLLARLGRHDQFTQDTTAILDGSHTTIRCLREGVVRACGYRPLDRATSVNPYPLLQYLPTMALILIGITDETVRHILAWANATAIVMATVLIVRFAGRRGGSRLGFLAFAAMASGMLVSYAGTTLGEPLAMLMLVCACLLTVEGPPTQWLTATVFLAVISKETFVVVVVFYLIGFLLLANESSHTQQRKLRHIGAGAGLGVAANLAFNVFRFGELSNVQYLNQASRPTSGAATRSFLSLLLSPNGGLMWFWWAGFAALCTLVITLGRRLVRERPDRFDRGQVGLLVIVSGFVAGTASLALWWMPFGWYAWGPRLLLPLVPPLFIATGIALVPMSRAAWRVGLGATAVAGILMLPNVAAAFATETSMIHWVATVEEQPKCQQEYDVRTESGHTAFHHCLMRAAWRTEPLTMVETLRRTTDDQPLWYWGTISAAALGSVLLLSRIRMSDLGVDLGERAFTIDEPVPPLLP